MTDNLRDRIAAVLNRHKPDGDRHNEWSDCQCGHVGTRWDDHVADAVIAELYPQRQCHICGRSGTQQFVACNSGWVCRSVFACEMRRLNA